MQHVHQGPCLCMCAVLAGGIKRLRTATPRHATRHPKNSPQGAQHAHQGAAAEPPAALVSFRVGRS